MKHNTKYLVLVAAVAGLGIGAMSSANAQGSGAADSNASPPSSQSSSSSSGASADNARHRGHWGPGPGGWGPGGGGGPGGGWGPPGGGRDHRGGPFDRAGWNHRRGDRFGPRRQHGRGMRRGRGPMLVGVLLRQVRELDLTDQQRQRVRDILTQARNQRQSNAPRAALDLSAFGNPGSRDFAKAVQEAKNRAVDRIQRQSELATQVYGVLTPVQKRQLATLLAADQIRIQQRQERMQQMRQRREQRRSGSSGGSSSSAG